MRIPMFEVGDLVEMTYEYTFREDIGIVVSRHMYTGNMWYRVRWRNGNTTEVAEIELKKIKTDKK